MRTIITTISLCEAWFKRRISDVPNLMLVSENSGEIFLNSINIRPIMALDSAQDATLNPGLIWAMPVNWRSRLLPLKNLLNL